MQVALAARRQGLPVLVRGDSHGGVARRLLAVRLAHRVLLRLYAAFLVVGKRNRDFYVDYGIPPGRLFDCPHFVDNERFAHAADASRLRREELRTGWGVPEDAVCAVFAGKLQPLKNVDGLLAALDRARASAPRLHLLIVGEGSEGGRLRRLARERSLPVSWAGFLNQSEMPGAYAAADLLVLPSQSETWCLVVNEAMACGRPAIVSDLVGCGSDLIVEGETGWRFPCGDVEALAAALAHAASDPEQLERMGAAARARVLADYSVDRAVAGTLAACDHVVRAKRDR
ncbi:MAG TPA: glycosyltransferase family 4 protein [Planctomycetota bacterium]|nr:glycosyltransferase family 4 protein [Planctomycetota bacterium]